MAAPSSDKAGIRQTIRALKAGGWEVSHVFDGGEDVDVKNETEAIEAVMAVDDAYLHVVQSANTTEGWVRFVMGNDPEEVICDHTVNLSEVIDPLMDSWN